MLINRQMNIITSQDIPKDDLELLHHIPKMPIKCSIAQPHSKKKNDIYSDLNVYIDKKTGMIQINPLIELELLYGTQHNDSTGSTWMRHHESFRNFIAEYNPKKVLELGAGSGILSKLFLSAEKDCTWTALDCNLDLLKDRTDIRTIQSSVDDTMQLTEEYDMVVHSHFLEHLYNPASILRTLSREMPLGSKHLFSIPNFRLWLGKKFSNTIFFEHTFYLDEIFTKHLLERNGFKLEKQIYFEEHSIFYSCENTKTYSSKPLENRYDELKQVYLEYVKYIDSFVSKVNDLTRENNNEVFLFGAHIFSQVLLASGLTSDNIRAILDNSDIKIGNRLYGSEYLIEHPSIISDSKAPVVILCAGAYQKEIRDQLTRINPLVRILEP
mgnify:FL=1